MAAILVTGGAGFLARAVLERLRAVRAGRLHVTDLAPGPGLIACDLRDPQAALRLIRRCRPDAVVHLAGTTRRLSWQELWDAHVGATLNLLDALARSPRPRGVRMVLAGSSAEYGAAPRLPVREDSEADPVSPYGAAKLSQSLAVLAARGRGVRPAIARIFNVLGPGMPESLALGSFARQIAQAEASGRSAVIHAGNLATRRDYLDVRDVAAALQALLVSPRAEGVFNVCSGRSLPMKGLLRMLAAQARFGARIATDRARLRRNDVPDLYGDCGRLRAATGWRPRIPIVQSLADTLDWHRGDLGARP